MGVEKELLELKEKLTKVQEWEQREAEIEEQLGKVWVEGADVLDPPSYLDEAAVKENEEQRRSESSRIAGDSNIC
jgi:ATP-binding cassette subfamily D (ALD) long-chain fatty acid import protein